MRTSMRRAVAERRLAAARLSGEAHDLAVDSMAKGDAVDGDHVATQRAVAKAANYLPLKP